MTLDASGSSDPDNDALTYTWREGATTIATGVSPTVTLGNGTHTITLTVGDGNTEPDWAVIDNGDGSFDVQVRAERKGALASPVSARPN